MKRTFTIKLLFEKQLNSCDAFFYYIQKFKGMDSKDILRR